MMNVPSLVVDRMQALLARYVAEFAVVATRRGLKSTLDLDASYAALRLQQRSRWPEGRDAVDAIGICAHDFLEAADAGGIGSPRAGAALDRHAEAVRRVEFLLSRLPAARKEPA